MTKEEKQLLIKALCGMLQYGVICTDNRHGNSRVFRVDINPSYSISKEEYAEVYYWDFDEWGFIENCKPYLRPMSSMTEEEKEYRMKLIIDIKHGANIDKLEDFYHSHYLDYLGLIEKGLALEAPEWMYKKEESK